MAHWQHRKEAKWSHFEFNQPYAKGPKRLKEEVLAKTDFDPATLWQSELLTEKRERKALRVVQGD